MKSGSVKRSDVATLKNDVAREKAAMGLLITLEPSTAPMRDEAADAGNYHSPYDGKKYPKIQILTIEEILRGSRGEVTSPLQMPPSQVATYKKAKQEKQTKDTI